MVASFTGDENMKNTPMKICLGSLAALLIALVCGCSMKYFEAQVKAEDLRTIGVDRANATSSASAVANENAATLTTNNNAATSECENGECK